ncbi:response regulator, partial [Halobium palmae]
MTESRGSIEVLHVDDDADFLELAKTFLERDDAGPELRVTTATDVATALDRVEEGVPDCVVSDYEMPGTDGLEFLRALRTRFRSVPFVLFTGEGSEDVARDAFRVGATDYMQKRSGSDQYALLAKRIRNAVAGYRAKVASERYDTVVDALGDAVFVLDGDGRLTSVNDGFLRLLGYERERALGAEVSLFDADGGYLASQVAALRSGEAGDSV